jgi:ABC-2 type transport system ATP-binding protein
MIEVEKLCKSYGSFRAITNLSFQVGEGEVVGFLGPNGAGKSTTLRILSCFLGMTSGRVTIAGHDIGQDPYRARSSIGYMPESVPLYPEMRVAEYLRFRAELKGVPGRQKKQAVTKAMEDARVEHMADMLIGKLSKGYRQRVGLADALVARPPILILDEPTAGLDPNQIREVRLLIKELSSKHTVLLSTHILSEVESTCKRAIVIARGHLVAEGNLEELKANRRSNKAKVVVRLAENQEAKPMTTLIKNVPNVAHVTSLHSETNQDLREVNIEWIPDSDYAQSLEDVVSALVQNGYGVREAVPQLASLDQVFAELTQDPNQGEEAAE